MISICCGELGAGPDSLPAGEDTSGWADGEVSCVEDGEVSCVEDGEVSCVEDGEVSCVETSSAGKVWPSTSWRLKIDTSRGGDGQDQLNNQLKHTTCTATINATRASARARGRFHHEVVAEDIVVSRTTRFTLSLRATLLARTSAALGR